MQALQSALGVVAIIGIAFLISENRRAVPWQPVVLGLALTFALALLMLKIPQTEIVFGGINRAVEAGRGSGPGPVPPLCSAMSVAVRCHSIRRPRARISFSRSRRCLLCW
jgi:hypothetical protein